KVIPGYNHTRHLLHDPVYVVLISNAVTEIGFPASVTAKLTAAFKLRLLRGGKSVVNCPPGVQVGVAVGVPAVGVAVGVRVAVGVAVGVEVGVRVAVGDAVGVAVGVGVGPQAVCKRSVIESTALPL